MYCIQPKKLFLVQKPFFVSFCVSVALVVLVRSDHCRYLLWPFSGQGTVNHATISMYPNIQILMDKSRWAYRGKYSLSKLRAVRQFLLCIRKIIIGLDQKLLIVQLCRAVCTAYSINHISEMLILTFSSLYKDIGKPEWSVPLLWMKLVALCMKQWHNH